MHPLHSRPGGRSAMRRAASKPGRAGGPAGRPANRGGVPGPWALVKRPMRLATLADGSRDGRLAVVRRDGAACADAGAIAPCLQAALDRWDEAEPRLRALAEALDAGRAEATPLDLDRVRAPLPRAYEWIDGSAYLNHVRLVRRARQAEPPPTLTTDPLVYQGGSGVLLGPRDPLPFGARDYGLDFEGEVCVITGDVPLGVDGRRGAAPRPAALPGQRRLAPQADPGRAGQGVRLLRQSKPATAFSPFAVTPDELGAAWRDGRAHLRLTVRLNGAVVGDLEAGPEMHFSFADLLAHVDPHPRPHRRHHPRLRHRLQPGPGARRLLPGRAAGPRADRVRRAAHALPGRSATGWRSRRPARTGATSSARIDQRVTA